MLPTLLKTARLPFLILAPLCVGLALSFAVFKGYSVSPLDTVLCFLAALFAHASVNMLNEYHDAISGVDDNTIRTPFSGGSGALQTHQQAASMVKLIGYVLASLVFFIGIYFVYEVGLELIPVGVLGLLAVMFYTPHINKLPIVCLFTPGLSFGFVMVLGSFYVLTKSIDYQLIVISIPVFCLVNNLLLLNQFPDVRADRQSGRKHFIIRYGRTAGKWVYLVQWLVAIYVTITAINIFALPFWSMLIPLAMTMGLASFYGLSTYLTVREIQRFVPFLAVNVVITLLYPLLMSAVLLSARH